MITRGTERNNLVVPNPKEFDSDGFISKAVKLWNGLQDQVKGEKDVGKLKRMIKYYCRT